MYVLFISFITTEWKYICIKIQIADFSAFSSLMTEMKNKTVFGVNCSVRNYYKNIKWCRVEENILEFP